MSEQEKKAEDSREFGIQKIYTKDISFETPHSPEIFRDEWKPEVNLQLSNTAVQLAEGVQEVTLTITVTTKVGRKTAYLAEIKQSGIFNIIGYSQQEMGFMVGSYCPNILFPYARELISDLVTRGGFPQMVLAPVNFEALYQQHIQQQSQSKEKAEAQPSTTH
ncbi:MAG: protein-export chaperone SecB [Gammaproteobacteria bacterium]|nr:protein-export chaperone SecB [Gammaproteobacteria bacterium]MDH5692560.1 protein-export chaperone SecB [Gammaproteobacteria bacterium]